MNGVQLFNQLKKVAPRIKELGSTKPDPKRKSEEWDLRSDLTGSQAGLRRYSNEEKT